MMDGRPIPEDLALVIVEMIGEAQTALGSRCGCAEAHLRIHHEMQLRRTVRCRYVTLQPRLVPTVIAVWALNHRGRLQPQLIGSVAECSQCGAAWQWGDPCAQAASSRGPGGTHTCDAHCRRLCRRRGAQLKTFLAQVRRLSAVGRRVGPMPAHLLVARVAPDGAP